MSDGVLVYNATREIPDWKNIDFDDSNWPAASVTAAAGTGYLIESQIPSAIRYPVEARHVLEALPGGRMEESGPDLYRQMLHHERVVLDFGRNMSAYYSLCLTAHGGDTVRVYPREKSEVNRPFIYVCREGKNPYTTPQLSVFRYLTLEVASRSGLKIDSLYALYSSYPVSYAGSFSCSDAFYTQLWGIIRWTTQMCMQSHYLDSPDHQEPICDTGDYLIESMSSFYAFGDRWLARQDLIKTARMLKKNGYHMFHTSYSLLWVQMIYNFFQHTGDSVLVRELLPHVNRLNDLFDTYLDEKFLLSQAPNYMFMDWVRIGKFNAHNPPASIGMGYLTAFYYKALLDAARLNEIGGNGAKCRDDLQLAEKIRKGVNAVLWDPARRIYKDGIPFVSRVKPYTWLPADQDTVTHSPQFNTLTVLYDIAPDSVQAAIMNYVMRRMDAVQPYFMFFVLSALDHIGKFDTDGLTAMDMWKEDVDPETYTLKEQWPDSKGNAGDLSHAWGGSPLYFLSAKILGVTPEVAGYERIRFVPCVSDRLTWAKGTVPLSDGNRVSVSWERSGRSNYRYYIQIPEHHHGVVHTPGRLLPYRLKVNGMSYGKIPEQPIVLSGGTYVIEYTNTGG
jgi:alpha-L-rhamnosidase